MTTKGKGAAPPPPPLRQKLPQEQVQTRLSYGMPPFEEADIGALKAVAAGQGSAEDQKRAIDYIVHVACQTYGLAFRPEGDRDTCLALGRQFVGQHIVYLLNYDLSKFRKTE